MLRMGTELNYGDTVISVKNGDRVFQCYRLGQSVSVLMKTECFSVNNGDSVSVLTMETECFSVNNGDSVSVLTRGSVSMLIMRTVCFSVDNGNSVFQCE